MPWQMHFLITLSAYGIGRFIEPLMPKWFEPKLLGSVMIGFFITYAVLLTLVG